MVLFNGKISDIRDVTCGIPQGSIMGPILFIFYINYLFIRCLINYFMYCLQMTRMYF